ncbi:hypothetical protein DER44DRAFT_798904 [Fusarium oxysporum]|nr:hypothetical protein DER44DRAFT_798904 [Fusarium oxysporum]
MESNDIMLSSPPSAFALLRSPRNLASQFELTTRVASSDVGSYVLCISLVGP